MNPGVLYFIHIIVIADWEQPTCFVTILVDNPCLSSVTVLSLTTLDNSLIGAMLELKYLRQMIIRDW